MDHVPAIYRTRGFFPDDIAVILENFKFPKQLKIAHGGFGVNPPFEKNTNLIIVDCTHHPWLHPPIPKLYENIPVLGLTGLYNKSDTKIVPQDENYIYYSYHFGYTSFLPNKDIVINNDLPRPYNFSCLNRSPKIERVWFYTQLFQQNFYKNSITSFYNEFPYGGNIRFDDLDEDTATFFKDCVLHLLPICIQSEKNIYIKHGKNYNEEVYHDHPAFNDAYVNIISEHSYTEKIITEKTIKPIAAQQLFLMAGPQFAIKELKNLGFDVFEDIIDHDYYDNEEHYKIRLLKMLEIAADLNNQNLKLIFEKTKQRREQNKNYLFGQELRYKIFSPIIEFINNNCF
jgi:hypothetical protein